MRCIKCSKPEIHCKGMCNACYTRWRRSGKPDLTFDYKTPVDKFEMDCRNGKVSNMIVQKMTHLDIARRYHISEATARKYMEKHKIIVIKAKKTKKKDRIKGIFYDESRVLALATPWVSTSERASYYG